MRWPLAKQLTPTRFLALVNVITGGLAFAKSVIVARGLGPELLGVTAVIGGINATLLNFLDVRLTDLAAKLYYQTETMDEAAQHSYRASVLLLCIAGNVLISMLLGVTGLLAASLLVGLFTDAPVAGWWLAAQAAMLGSANVTSTLTFLQRFSGRFYFVGTIRLVIQLVSLAVFLWLFVSVGAINGYYFGGMAGNVLTLALTGLLTVYLWARHDRLPVFGVRIGQALPGYRRHLRFLFYGNLLGYTKLLHRAADVLWVGYFADDRVTGLYKLARSLTDGLLYVLFDSMNQVYQPHFLSLLAAREIERYRKLANRLFGGCFLFTASLLISQVALLRPFLFFVFGDKYSGAENAIIVFTATFFFVAGMYTWLWPTFIHSGRLGWFTVMNMIAAVGQYGVILMLFMIFGPSATSAAVGYLAHYMILYPIAYEIARSRFPAYLPGWPRV